MVWNTNFVDVYSANLAWLSPEKCVLSSSLFCGFAFCAVFGEDFLSVFELGSGAVRVGERCGAGKERCEEGQGLRVGRAQSEPRGTNGRGARRRRCASPTAARVWYMGREDV
jgi:hypothetical protein